MVTKKKKKALSWQGRRHRRKVLDMVKRVDQHQSAMFDNDMKDLGWDASVGPYANAQMAMMLKNEALPILMKICGIKERVKR